MKNLTLRAFAPLAVFFLFLSLSVKAQTWGDFSNLLNQINEEKRNEYLKNLQSLQAANQGVYNFSGILDSLDGAVNGTNPTSGVYSQLPTDSLVRDSLLQFLSQSGFASFDSLSIIAQYDSIIAAWQIRQDSLLNIFGQTQGSVDGSIGLPTDYTGQFWDWRFNVDSLVQNQASAFDATTPPTGLGGFEEVFKELFDGSVFSRIEFNAGNQFAKTNYYGLREELNAPVIGLRTIEAFDRVWEPRWRVSMSWFNNKTNSTNEGVSQQNEGINPFIMNGSFDIMFNPQIVDGGGSDVRFITLLGVEVGTYAPAHRNAAIPRTLDNKGYTTGWGPVIGAGLTTTVGGNTVYALGSTAFGDVVCNPDQMRSNYRYRSNRMEAGVRFNNLVTVRYEMALSTNWANDGDKHVRYHQVTVGLPTTGLFK
jgi:hypothetical protein